MKVQFVGQFHEQVLGVALHLEAQSAHKHSFELQQALDFQVEAVAPLADLELLVQAMRVDVGIASRQPLEVLAHMQQVPIHLNQHLPGHLVSELRLKVILLAVLALLSLLVLLLISQSEQLLDSFLSLGHSLYALLNQKSLDVDQPPIALLILYKIAH